jgi:hypothetical protein
MTLRQNSINFRIARFVRILSYLMLLSPLLVSGQSSFAPLNQDYYHWVDRYEVKAGKILPYFFTSIKPYKRSAIVDFIDSVQQMGLIESKTDKFNYNYLRNDSWEWSDAETSVSKRPILRHFFKRKSDFFSIHNKDFDLHFNPVIAFSAGKDNRRDDKLFVNTRGVEVRGMVDNKVGFYTYLTDNQTIMPSYVWERVSATHPSIPHEGFWKDYREGKGADYLQARGYITYDISKHINLQLGHDRFFIGNGYRSLAFSDFSPPAMFFKTNVQIWKVNYFFLITKMTAQVKGSNRGLRALGKGYPDKFNAFHHVSINIGKRFNLGVFESVIFSKSDSLGSQNLRLDYFNPIIFYRAVEQQNGSSDNVLIGMDFKWNVVKKLQLYGQVMLDEFVIGNIRAQNGWWANKFGIQGGGRYVDAFGVPNLDFQGEINIVRPYTYSHGSTYGSYSNYMQPIAHPLGANFEEAVGIMRVQPLPRLNLTAKIFIVKIGRDDKTAAGKINDWGSDIMKNNSLHPKEFGNKVGQGASNTIMYGSFNASWMIMHNLFMDANAILRRSTSKLPFYDNTTTVTSLALRWNIPQRLYEY